MTKNPKIKPKPDIPQPYLKIAILKYPYSKFIELYHIDSYISPSLILCFLNIIGCVLSLDDQCADHN